MKKKTLIAAASIGIIALTFVASATLNNGPALFQASTAAGYTLEVTAEDVNVISPTKSTVETTQGSLIPFGHTNIALTEGNIVLTEGTLYNYDDVEINEAGGALSGMTSFTVKYAAGSEKSLVLSYGWTSGAYHENTIQVGDTKIDLAALHHPNYFKLSGTGTIESIVAEYSCTRGVEPFRVYLKAGWSKANIYTWDANGTPLQAWPGAAMSKNEDGLFYFEYDTSTYINVIFNDGSEQTPDLASPTSKEADCYDFSKGAWVDDEDAFVVTGTAKVYVVLNWASITDVKFNGAVMAKSDDATKGNYMCEVEVGATTASFSFKQSGATWHPTDSYSDKNSYDWSTSSKLKFKTTVEAGAEYQVTDISWKYQWDNNEHKWFSYTWKAI